LASGGFFAPDKRGSFLGGSEGPALPRGLRMVSRNCSEARLA